MATRKGIHISGNYVVHHKVYAFFKSVFFILKSCKVQTESYFISFQKLNNYPTRCFNFVLDRVHPKGFKFELNFKKIKSKRKHF